MNSSAITYAIISHDAGGAEILSSLVRQQHWQCLYVLEGPARNIFSRKLGNIEVFSLEDAVYRADMVLCGTSWQSDLEFNAIKLARKLAKRSVSFLDHWVNYRERFERKGEVYLPDEIWVGDSDAEAIAKSAFPDQTILLIENPYVQDLKKELAGITTCSERKQDKLSVLYVTEPLREHALRRFGNERHWGYVEEEALEYFLSNLKHLGLSVDQIVIRPHPSEPQDKYDWAIKKFGLPISRGGKQNLLTEIAESDVVVGCETMAMVVGLLAGKRVISCIPPGGRRCVLPHKDIEHLQGLVAKTL